VDSSHFHFHSGCSLTTYCSWSDYWSPSVVLNAPRSFRISILPIEAISTIPGAYLYDRHLERSIPFYDTTHLHYLHLHPFCSISCCSVPTAVLPPTILGIPMTIQCIPFVPPFTFCLTLHFCSILSPLHPYHLLPTISFHFCILPTYYLDATFVIPFSDSDGITTRYCSLFHSTITWHSVPQVLTFTDWTTTFGRVKFICSSLLFYRPAFYYR